MHIGSHIQRMIAVRNLVKKALEECNALTGTAQDELIIAAYMQTVRLDEIADITEQQHEH